MHTYVYAHIRVYTCNMYAPFHIKRQQTVYIIMPFTSFTRSVVPGLY